MKKIFLVLLFSILLLSLIPNLNAKEDSGIYYNYGGTYVVEIIQWSAAKMNQDFYIWFRINDDKGKVIATGGTVNCSAYMWQPDTLTQFALVGNSKMDVVSPTALRAKINSSFLNVSGEYTISVNCEDATFGGWVKAKVPITYNGKIVPDGITLVFFLALFLVIVSGMLSLLLFTILHFINLDFSMKHLTINLSSYFGIFAFYILQKEYLGNKFVDDFLLFLIDVGAVTTVVLPIIAFFVVFIKERMENKKMDRSYK